ncbi:MAG: molecular chaperone HtpG [Gammaproteobacteria bacterium]|nr:molecular chaperone HtpG [Gammaproteobacteria bacterium]
MSAVNKKEMHGFQTEVKQLLDLMIHSLYSNKEIFLRELISNASDALDKLRFSVLSDSSYAKYINNDSDYHIRVELDKGNKVLIIEDNGIGMNRQEVMENLGTIAKSGTKAFVNSLSGDNAKDTQLIGQFGVGFYSVFMVASSVMVETRRANEAADQAIRWQSIGDGNYTLESISKVDIGTKIIITLKSEEEEFLDSWRIKSIISKYSDHIAFPVIMKKENLDSLENTDSENTDSKNKETIIEEDETVNKATALWLRSKKDITKEEYDEFYKHISHDYQEPLVTMHNRVEGKLDYTSLLYIPSAAPFNLMHRDQNYGLKLYVNRVFIMDDVAQFLPSYLRFVRGIVDCNELQLNVSREILQQSKTVDNIKSALTKRILDQLETMAKDEPDNYKKFWKVFGNVLKEGPAEDFANREKIAKLLRFASTYDANSNTTGEQTTTLDEYISRMKPEQDKIYYITAETYAQAKNSPYLEKLKEKDIEVILLFDRIDEWLMSNLSSYEKKTLVAINKGDLDLGSLEDKEDKAKQEQQQTEYKDLLDRFKQCLGNKVKEVKVSSRLKDSPSCIVADKYDMGLQLQRLMKAAGQDMPPSLPIFEINVNHPIVSRLNSEQDANKFSDWANILFDQAMLAESGTLEDPASFVQRLNNMLVLATFS